MKKLVLSLLIPIILLAGCTTRFGSFIQNISSESNQINTSNTTPTSTPTVIHQTTNVTSLPTLTQQTNVTTATVVQVTNSSQNTPTPKIYNVIVDQGIGIVSKGG